MNAKIPHRHTRKSFALPRQTKKPLSKEAPPLMQVAEALAQGSLIQGDLQEIASKPLLLLFFSFISIQSKRMLAYAQAWRERYHSSGFEVVGVHCPEIDRADSPSALRISMQQWGIGFPIVHDPHRKIWRALGNHSYESCHLFHAEGQAFMMHDSTSLVRQIELDLQRMLKIHMPPKLLEPLFPEDQPGATLLQCSADVHLGSKLGEIANMEGLFPHQSVDYKASGLVGLKPLLGGGWQVNAENLIATPLDGEPSTLEVRCNARDVYIVAEAATPALLRIESKGLPPQAPVLVQHLGLYKAITGVHLASHHLKRSTEADGLHLYMLRFTTEARNLRQ